MEFRVYAWSVGALVRIGGQIPTRDTFEKGLGSIFTFYQLLYTQSTLNNNEHNREDVCIVLRNQQNMHFQEP